MTSKQYHPSSLETAAVAWEAVLEILNGGAGQKGLRAEANRIRDEIGTSGLRLTVLEWVDEIDAAWAEVKDQYDQPFDWEFVPAWIADNIDWSGDRPTYRKGGQ